MALPAKAERHEASIRETTLYVARPGIGALPEGAGLAIAFAVPQALMCCAFLWIVWFPWPTTERALGFDIGMTILLCGLGAFLFWRIARGNGDIARGIVRAPFVRLTVTDRRLVWSVPWSRRPLMELDAARIMGGILGDTDGRGRGTAAIILVPGDPAGDFENRIHLDRLPDAAGFVAALGRLA
ncbi:hypothetical protein [Sphingomonas profundi]|uniref:hypothetical protein n=1 Tax=Alterirhizorhabdus profundi TaxID=2681549 RepID=UPI0012E7EF71|nr:hypothetical protein [Sphingomonas profundi]